MPDDDAAADATATTAAAAKAGVESVFGNEEIFLTALFTALWTARLAWNGIRGFMRGY